MRFLANENFPAAAVRAIAEAGHDIACVRTSAPGSTDVEVLAWAVRENRILLTFDKDFGELAWRAKLPAASGIILFRIPMPPPDRAGARL
jgi:predicted nuclease of predicted toxin-antitoxin system